MIASDLIKGHNSPLPGRTDEIFMECGPTYHLDIVRFQEVYQFASHFIRETISKIYHKKINVGLKVHLKYS